MGLSGLPCTLVTPRTAFGCFEQLVLTNGAYCRELKVKSMQAQMRHKVIRSGGNIVKSCMTYFSAY